MVNKLRTTARAKTSAVTKRRPKHEVLDEEERILQASTIHLITYHGGLLVATAARETRIKGFRVWIVTVTLRYPTGHDGYVGDLLYDGDEFTFLTEQSVMDERVAQIAADPERERKWNEYRASTLSAGER